MGRLTDLLNQRGLINTPNHEKSQEPSPSQIPSVPLSHKIPEEDLTDELKIALKDLSAKYLNKKKVFQGLPSIAEFYIPASMNGRVIQCSENSFLPKNEERVLLAKAYRFDGYEVRFLYYDIADKSLQKGTFEEFPRDGFGKTMGKLGFQENILCWISKKSRKI